MTDLHADQLKREKYVFVAFWSAFAIGAFGLAMSALASDHGSASKVLALGVLVGGAATLIGGLLGFLFGLPRSAAAEGPHADSAPPNNASNGKAGLVQSTTNGEGVHGRGQGFVNNNLLEISDWLTKIIVGAGLVSLKQLVGWIGGVGQIVGNGAGFAADPARVFGCSVITFYFAWGFLYTYIQTRTIISFVFASMERSLRDLGASISDAVATEVRETILPQIDRVSENGILQMLYSSDPGSAAAVALQAREFLAQPGNATNARVWLYLACAYGQQHAKAAEGSFRVAAADKALDALQHALTADPHLHGLARGLLYVDDPQHLPGDDDLASLRMDPRFQKLVGPPQETSKVAGG